VLRVELQEPLPGAYFAQVSRTLSFVVSLTDAFVKRAMSR
jgi:hypothetical protein